MVKKIMSLVLAFITAFVFVNGVMFFYERPLSWIDTPNGASGAIRSPGKTLVHGTEGYSISKIDRRGYTNLDFPLSNEYILIMGASHTQGKEMSYDKRYSTVINNHIVKGKKELAALNIACDGHFLPDILKHFKAAVSNYPNSKCITIQIHSTDYTIQSLRDSLIQPQKIDYRTAKEIFESQSTVMKIKNQIKEKLPLIAMIKNHLETTRNKTVSEETNFYNEEYKKVLNQALSLIRSEYEGKIVFVYNPSTDIQKDSNLKINRSESIDIFKESCKYNKIDFIDLGEDFVNHYKKYHELPYGFSNTAPGNGHLNEIGHRIMADSIIKYLQEEGII